SAKPAAPEPPLPGTASFASLRLQQRNEIMESDPRSVNTLLANYFKKSKSLKNEQRRAQSELVRHPVGFPWAPRRVKLRKAVKQLFHRKCSQGCG
ncbi:hypothetical protein, partial [Paraburkholderia atlantica]|uniref:hypothetical protein n=1 Tax=Paraburkholderia atlantica TaxID=2654982 RepID=UPI001C85DE2C